MLFLTMGGMRHEPLWALWFKQANLLVPKDCITSALCGMKGADRFIQEYGKLLEQRQYESSSQ